MTNSVSNKRAQVELIAVGRNGMMRICRMRPDLPNRKGSNETVAVPAGKTLRQALMSRIAKEITTACEAFTAAGKKASIEIYTVGQVAIKYYQMVPYLKGGRFMTTEDIEALSINKDGSRNNDTEADHCAYDDLAQALANAFKAGHAVHLQASGNAALFELIIPEDVTVYDGQVLNFVDGVSAEGVRVRGWNKANREDAVVQVKGTLYPRAYISKAKDPEKPWKSLAKLLNTIKGCWDELPGNDDASKDDGSVEELYA